MKKQCIAPEIVWGLREPDSAEKKARRIADTLFKDAKIVEATKKLALLKDPAYIEKLKNESIARCVEKSKLMKENKKRTMRMVD